MTQTAPQNAKVFVVSALLFFGALFMTSYSARNPVITGKTMGVASELTAPVQSGFHWVYSYLYSHWESYVALLGVVEENERLTHRLTVLESEYSKLLEYQYENQRLRALLDLKDSHAFNGVVANVIAHDPSRWADTITVDVGSSQGVKIQMPVVIGDGVVGQVVSTSRNSARVLLVTDPTSGVDAILQESRVRGVVEGRGEFRLFWNYVSNDFEVKVGERVVTSGKDGVYPRGLLLGVVSNVVKTRGNLFQKITVSPSVDFSQLETLMVVTGVEGNEYSG